MNHAVRTRVGGFAAGALLFAGAALALTGTASAAPADPGDLPEEAEKSAGPPGDNGTVKVHDPRTPPEDMRNEPHVCTFTLVGSNFDGEQQVWWKIRTWPPGDGSKERPVVLEGDLALDGEGHGETEEYELPDGHYKLFWNFEGENGRAKQKVFWVDCGDEESEKPGDEASEEPETPGEEGGTPGETAPEETPGAGQPDGEAPGEEDGERQNPPAEDEPSPSPEEEGPAPSADGDDGSSGGLPVTGAALGGIVAAGAVAVGGGAAAMVLARRRKAAASGEGAQG